MRLHVFTSVALFALTLAACDKSGTTSPGGSGGTSTATGTGGIGGGSGGTGTTTDTGTGGTTPTAGWTLIPLLDDHTDPNTTVFRSGSDLVTGIRFSSLDDGWVVTSGSQSTFTNGGAIFKAKHHQLTDILFSGNRDGLCLLGTIDFSGLDKSKDGWVALAHGCDVIQSHDGGKTFDISANGAGIEGIERQLAIRTRASDTVALLGSGYVAASTSAPGPSAFWNTTYAPQAIPTVPNPVPADQCHSGPNGAAPVQTGRVYVSPDGQLIAYTSLEGSVAKICVSKDGGKSFFPKDLPGLTTDEESYQPSGVVFANATTGIAFLGIMQTDHEYLYRTTDGGDTWSRVALPADVVSSAVELAHAFFAPDGQHGWIVGYHRDTSTALLLRTTDAGATWKRSGGDLGSKVDTKLFTGFALDANHIWVGGDYGVLAASDTGGE